MAGTLVSPSFDLKIRKRNALYKKHSKSPHFRDALRERYHSRIQASRASLIDKFRNLRSENERRSVLSVILDEELENLVLSTAKPFGQFSDLVIDEEVEEEEEDEDKWIIEEYERILLAEEEALFNFDWDSEVICPLCEREVLSKERENIFSCKKCEVLFPPVPSLQHMHDCLNSSMQQHQGCRNNAQFFLLCDALFLICHTCGFCIQSL